MTKGKRGKAAKKREKEKKINKIKGQKEKKTRERTKEKENENRKTKVFNNDENLKTRCCFNRAWRCALAFFPKKGCRFTRFSKKRGVDSRDSPNGYRWAKAKVYSTRFGDPSPKCIYWEN